jgi:3',5'-cyclic AMP phosphodiesterase CpdA
VSDTHIGMETFGFWPNVTDPLDLDEPPPERCLRAALAEATAWGAQLVVAKGDMTQHGDVDEARRVVAILEACGLPVEAYVGNHEVRGSSEDLAPVFATAGITLVQRGVRVRDVPGLRLVMVDSTIKAKHVGSYDAHGAEVLAAAGDASTPVMVLAHHPPMPLPFPWFWPPGVPSPEAHRFLDALGRANRRALLTAGHTHRHRRYRRGQVEITEVGSTHDYPGTWAGYVVHEGGIRQVVRRIAAPDAIAWTEATRRTVLGAWGRWSPGEIQDRCFSLAW